MLVMGQSISANASKDKPTEKHLFAMDSSKVSALMGERSDSQGEFTNIWLDIIIVIEATFIVTESVNEERFDLS